MIKSQLQQLEDAIRSDVPLSDIVAMLRRFKEQGLPRSEVYSFLENLQKTTADDSLDDRILEVSDFVAGFCSPHMKVWDD